MKKQPEFLIAKNPMSDPDGVYIFHSRKPRFLAKVENNIFEVVDDIDEMTAYYKGNVDKVQGLFRTMEKWYVACRIYKKNCNVKNCIILLFLLSLPHETGKGNISIQ
ncbi:MAG: hypothetical protein LBG96_11920 [Tannerella sp.]|jgi:hypothetical protein|nr:hypothetical protein [Tannerella sp.]